MLFGENSTLPVYQTVYSGSLRDVSTLKSTIFECSALTDIADLMLVMDKMERRNGSKLAQLLLRIYDTVLPL
jgi:transposase